MDCHHSAVIVNYLCRLSSNSIALLPLLPMHVYLITIVEENKLYQNCYASMFTECLQKKMFIVRLEEKIIFLHFFILSTFFYLYLLSNTLILDSYIGQCNFYIEELNSISFKSKDIAIYLDWPKISKP